MRRPRAFVEGVRRSILIVALILTHPMAASAQETPISEASVETLYRDARAARLGGRTADAVRDLKRAAAIEPDNADVQVELGLALAATKQFEDAKQAFSAALRKAPAYDDAQLGLARTRFWNGEIEAAGDALKPLLQRAPDHSEAKELAAQIDAARAAAAAAAKAPPSPAPAARDPIKPVAPPLRRTAQSAQTPGVANAGGVLARAEKLRRQGKFVEAEKIFRGWTASNPRDVDSLVNLGLVQAFQGERRFADARAAFNQALAINPNSIDAKLGVVRVDFYSGDLDSAESGVADVLTRIPDHMDALSMRARIRLARQDARGAEQDFAELARRNPKDADALVGLGDSMREQQRDEEAQAIFRQALALTPGSADIRRRLDLPLRPRWRIDLDGTYARLTKGFAPWKEGAIHVGYVWDDRTAITLGAETDYRFRKADTLLDARIDSRWSRAIATYLRAGFTPAADFRPSALVEGGGSLEIRRGDGAIGATLLLADFGLSHYRGAGDVKTGAIGVAQYFFDGRFWLTGKLIGTIATNGEGLRGYSIRVDAKLSDRLGAFAGYADAPDNSEGRTFPSKAVYGGISYDLTERVSVRASAAHEARTNSYSRTSFSVGLTSRY